jgi:CBS domain-containing protein
LTPENFHSLLSLNVGRFLEETQQYHKLPVFVHYGDHVDTVAKAMRNNHIHRVFVVDDNKKPVGVISSSDLVNLLTSSWLEKEQPTATGV